MTQVLMLLAPTNFRDEEYYETREVLEKHKIKIITTSTSQIVESKTGKHEEVDLLLNELEDLYDALILVGGSGSRAYYEDSDVHSLVKKYVAEGKLIAAICAAPGILAHAGLLQGKKATANPPDQPLLESKGAILVQEDVVVDGDIITASGPPASKAFGEAIAKKLKG